MKYKIKSNVIYSLLTGAVLAYTLFFLINENKSIFTKEYVLDVNIYIILLLTAVFGGALFALFHITGKVRRDFLIYSVFIFGLSIASKVVTTPIYFTFVIIGIITWLTLTFKEVFPDKPFALFEGKKLYIIVGALTAFAICIVSWGTILRYKSFTASTFDFGIFTQMFESMATDFTQNTTLERNALLSHFSVHFSPIYYLLLPFYMIFRCPEFLLVAQAVIVFSAVIPILLLCKKWRYGGSLTLLISTTYLTLISVINPCFYDFHENAFLAPLILWLFYFLEKNSTIGVLVTTLLTLCVKEDAGLYIIIIAFYALFEKRYSRRTSFGLLILGVGGFIGATAFINAFGETIKTNRYSVFLNEGESSLINVAANVIKNPANFIYTLFSSEKLIFMLQMLVPLGFVPFRSRKVHDYILFLPLILVNLATTYVYQYDVGYQYIFASGACLIFLFVKNIRYVKTPVKIGAICLMTSILMTVTYMSGIYKYHIENTSGYPEECALTESALAEIDTNASVISTTYLTPHLYKCKNIYMYPSDIAADIIVLDKKPGKVENLDGIIDDYISKGYTLYKEQGWVIILHSSTYAPPVLAE